ncbi:C2 domain-containing protein [Sporodiniella umbellata]|nr:C2 domain-containing protein [Sporodiniella umbellata]
MSKPRIVGELVIVAYKARNLPNREVAGKQDPFVIFRVGEHMAQTKTDYRGGQHPLWDDQVNMPIPEKKKEMLVQVYDEDSKRKDLISECDLDLTEVLEKGEQDGWFPLHFKNRKAGEIYLEMTFYSAAPPPKRQPTRYGVKPNKAAGYGNHVPSVNPIPGSYPTNTTRPSATPIPSGYATHTQPISSSATVIPPGYPTNVSHPSSSACPQAYPYYPPSAQPISTQPSHAQPGNKRPLPPPPTGARPVSYTNPYPYTQPSSYPTGYPSAQTTPGSLQHPGYSRPTSYAGPGVSAPHYSTSGSPPTHNGPPTHSRPVSYPGGSSYLNGPNPPQSTGTNTSLLTSPYHPGIHTKHTPQQGYPSDPRHTHYPPTHYPPGAYPETQHMPYAAHQGNFYENPRPYPSSGYPPTNTGYPPY